MLGLTRLNPFDEVFKVQRDVERMFDRFWNELPAQTVTAQQPGFDVKTTDEDWNIRIPVPGVDPQNITLEQAGNTLTIRAVEPHEDKSGTEMRYEQSFTVPQFLDVEKVSASHHHGMLQLRLPLKDSIKPRRIQIAGITDKKQIAA
jgi:HSP20 family protein